jgi:hypothetical protein
MKYRTLIVVLIASSLSQGAFQPSNLASSTEKALTVQREIGGQAGAGFTLLNVQKIQSKNLKVERIVFDIGTRDGAPLKGLPGYFNAQNQIKPNRIVINFSQMVSSKLDEQSLLAVLGASPFIQGGRLRVDPVDGSLTLILDLKTLVHMKALQVAGQKNTAKVVLDLTRK